MERTLPWLLVLGVVLFVALAIWSALDQNWSGVIVSVVLGALCVAGLLRRPPAR